MKKFVIFAVVALLTGVAFYVSQRSGNINTDSYDAGHLDWCERIYHRNISCPRFGQVKVPATVLARERAEYFAWCESIHYQNAGCPKNDELVSAAVLAEREADYLAWCDQIGHRNIGCPDYKKR